jgi:hypothetical protein
MLHEPAPPVRHRAERRGAGLAMLPPVKVPHEDEAEPGLEGEAPRAPAGTWASDGDEIAESARTSPDESSDRLVRPSRPPPILTAVPAIPPPAALPSPTSSASPITGAPLAVARPPFLASVLMRKRDEHREPIWSKRGRAAAILGGATATALAFATGSVDALVASFAATAAMTACAALLPLPDGKRALLVLCLGLVTLALGAALRQSPDGANATVLALGLASGLVLRSKRSRSWSARALVALALLLAVFRLVVGGVRSAIAESYELAAIVPPIVTLALVVLVALAVLGFIDEHGPSAAAPLAGGAMLWALVEAVGAAAVSGTLGPAQAGALGAAAVMPATAIALAQALGGPLPATRRTRHDERAAA